jgi:F-type H+-transporting ATPase subunit b
VFFLADLPSNWFTVALDPKSNVINWVVLVGLLAWLCAKYLPPVFKARDEAINAELLSARQAKEDAAKMLAEQKEKVAKADQEAEHIIAEARQAAQEMRWQIEKQTEKEVSDLLNKIEQSLRNERNMAVAEMRAVAIRAAIKLAESSLRSSMNDQAKAKLLTQFVEQLDNINQTQQVVAKGQLESIQGKA